MAGSPAAASAEPVEIRAATSADHEAVAAVTVAAYESLAGMPLHHYRSTLLDVAGRAADADVLVAAEPGGRVVGAVTYVPGPHSAAAEFTDPEASGIRFLAVDPESRGRGTGAALVRACVERARASGRSRLLLHSTAWMTAAMRLYERLGFTRAPELDWEPEPGVELIGFAYEIDERSRW